MPDAVIAPFKAIKEAQITCYVGLNGTDLRAGKNCNVGIAEGAILLSTILGVHQFTNEIAFARDALKTSQHQPEARFPILIKAHLQPRGA
jgi:hypothetical protein